MIAASRRAANVPPRQAFASADSLYAGEHRDIWHCHLGCAEPVSSGRELFLGGQPFEELPQRPELDAGVRAAVPVQ